MTSEEIKSEIQAHRNAIAELESKLTATLIAETPCPFTYGDKVMSGGKVFSFTRVGVKGTLVFAFGAPLKKDGTPSKREQNIGAPWNLKAA